MKLNSSSVRTKAAGMKICIIDVSDCEEQSSNTDAISLNEKGVGDTLPQHRDYIKPSRRTHWSVWQRTRALDIPSSRTCPTHP
jgi:hypothetical protein